MARLLFAFLAIALLSVSASPTVAAQAPDTADDREARGLFEAGREAFGAARYDRALDYFRQSYALSHRPALLYNIAQSADRLRRDREALEAFEQFLAEVPDSAERPAVEARIGFLRQALERPAVAPVTVAPPDDPPPAEEPRTSGPGALPWVLTVGGGALAIAGAISLVLASSNAAEVSDAMPGTPWTDLEGAYAASGTLGWLGGALLVGGAALAGVGVVLLFTSSSNADEPTPTASAPPLRLGLSARGLVLSGGWL